MYSNLRSHRQSKSILTTLLNEIITIPDNFIFVLDDYHLLDSKAVDNALTFLLEHLPPQMHLVITTREDPNLPLARLRVRDQLTELRAADLRFTSSEAAEFLNQVMGLHLSTEDIAALEDPHRRLDRRAAISRTVDAGTPGCRRIHPGIRRRQPLHRGLFDRRGPAAPARSSPQLPTPDCHSRPLEWSAVRCRHRPAGTAARGWKPCSGATSFSFRWMTSVTGIAITIFLPMSFVCT